MLLDEDLKDRKDKDKTASSCSNQEVVDFLTQFDENPEDHRDNGRRLRSFSGQEVVDFLTQLEEDLKDRKGQGQGGEVRPPSMPRQRRPRAATGPSTGCERQGGR